MNEIEIVRMVPPITSYLLDIAFFRCLHEFLEIWEGILNSNFSRVNIPIILE